MCGSELQDLSENEQKVYKSESVRLKLKYNKLTKFILERNEIIRDLNFKKFELEAKIREEESKLNHVRMEFISPYLEEIEMYNLELGEQRNQLRELDRTLNVIHEFHSMIHKLSIECAFLNKLKKQEKDILTNSSDKDSVIDKVSQVFNDILESYNFPKLSNAYIAKKDYLPYVRGRKYNQIGSLGSVTMITMAYYLSVLVVGIEEGNNHPGLLIIDTPRKNLGADPKDESQFKDEKIYNAIINYFIQLDHDKEKQMQLIIINNGYPTFLPEKHIIAKFDGDGSKDLPYGLIDDAVNDSF